MDTWRIMYVDDDLTIARLVKRIFEKQHPSYEILVVGSACEAAEQLQHLSGLENFPRALVTDVRLGGSDDGPELVEELRAHFPQLRMIVVSGVHDPKVVQRARSAGANAFLEKGLSIPTFVNELVELIQAPPS